MEALELEKFAQNLHLVVLPCTSWAVHIDPKFNYIAAIHLDVTNFTKLNVDKGILLTAENNLIKASVFINNDLIATPNFASDIKVASDLTQLIYAMHDLKICVNSENYVEFPNCVKYIGGNFSNVCSACEDISTGCTNEENIYINREHSMFVIDNDQNLLNKDLCIDSAEITNQLVIQNDDIDNNKCDYILNEINPIISESQENRSECNLFENFEKSDNPFFSCNVCNKCFPTENQLKDHTKLHTDNNAYVCTICNKTMSQKSSFKRHMLTHSKIKPNLCNVCGKTFCLGYRMEDHMLIHTNEKPFECNVCKKAFSKNYNLKLHEKTHTGERPYICCTCGKTYTTRSNLRTHIMSIHTNKKPHSCNSCNMSFVHPRLLKIHMRKHTGEKPYKCTLCNKAFPKKIHLTVHTRFHTGEKPHVCSFCGKGFTTTGNLSSHKKVHHKDNL